jgi:Flp pilus assembly protein TadD
MTAFPFSTEKVIAAPAQPSGLAAAFLAGRHAQATYQDKAAINFYDQALQYDNQNLTLLSSTYFLAAQMGDFPAAVQAARKAYDIEARAGMAPVILAADHMKRAEFDRAWVYLSKMSAQSMNGFAMPLLRAWGQAPSQPVEKTVAELAGLKNFQDASDLVEAQTGLLNEFYGKPEAALAQYDALAKRAGELRLSILRIAVEGYTRLGKPEQAKAMITAFQAARGNSPMLDAYKDSPPPPRKVTAQMGFAEALYDAAELLLLNDANDYRAQVAIAYARAALYVDPDITIARRFIGNTLYARTHYDESTAILSTIKRSAPDYFEAQMQIAENDNREGKTADALGVLKGVQKEKPNWPDVYITLGDLLRGDKKFAEAADAYTSALKLEPANRKDNWALYYTRGIALERSKHWDEAEKDFRKALELNPDEPNVLNYLGYSYLDRGTNLKEARKLIETAYAKRPDDGYIIDSYGWMLYSLGEYDKAAQALEKAVEAAPADATINEHLGDALWKVGRLREARFQWQAALGLDAEDTQRTTLRGKIEHGLAQK